MPRAKSTTSVYPQGMPQVLAAPTTTLGAWFSAQARTHAARPFLHFMGTELTYAQVLAQAQTLAAQLQKMGVKPGARVALVLPNCPAYVVAFYATHLAGGVVVNVSPLASADELAAQLNMAAPTVIIALALNPVWANLQQALTHHPVPPPLHLIAVDLAASLPPVKSLFFKLLKWKLRPRVRAGVPFFHTVVAAAGRPKPVRRKPADVALLQFTGGTTGTPKAAALTHAGLLANTEQIRLWLGPTFVHPTFLAVLPLFHIFASTTILGLAVASGGKVILLPQFNLGHVLKALVQHRVNILHGVPALFNAVATAVQGGKIHTQKLAHLKFGISGGAPLPAAIKTAFEHATRAVVVEGYGLTEASPVVACNPHPGLVLPAGHVPPPGAVGLLLPGTTVKIVGLEKPHRVLPTGHTGEVCVQGPQLMAGYWQQKKATADVLKNGWLHTGDVGHVDAQGYLFITGRLKEMIAVSGFKVYPRQLEDALLATGLVAEAAVIGVPHPKTGEAPYAFVVPKLVAKQPPALLEKTLAEHLQKTVARYAQPLRIEVVQALPKTPVGKVLKRNLQPTLAARR